MYRRLLVFRTYNGGAGVSLVCGGLPTLSSVRDPVRMFDDEAYVKADKMDARMRASTKQKNVGAKSESKHLERYG